MAALVAALGLGAVALVCALVALITGISQGQRQTSAEGPAVGGLRIPVGTNLGGFLVLEDWFFSGNHGRHVMTKDKKGRGYCLPPGLLGTNEPWPSEGILVNRLNKTHGPKKVVEIFEAHRHSFIGESDFSKMKLLGLKMIRLPITWAVFADALASVDTAAYGAHNPDTESKIVPDPFYVESAAFVTVPRSSLRQLLVKASDHGLKVVLDIHNFPGGSADGTYNGVWPNPPVFWNSAAKLGSNSTSLMEIGLSVAQALIRWVEDLDPIAQGAVGGLTLMNEPAHMAAIRPFATKPQILAWLSTTADYFRKSTLPGKGVKLYLNVIGTAFPGFSMPWEWWNATFTREEQTTWVVMDTHWYAAWSASCEGRLVSGGGYLCDQPISEIRAVLSKCVEQYAQEVAEKVGDGLKACSEFSCGTYQNTLYACNDHEVLQTFLDVQLEVLAKYDIQPFFWTWRMPYGETFERAWSLKMLTHLEEMPPPYPCSPNFEDQ